MLYNYVLSAKTVQLQASIDSSVANAVLNIDPANLNNVIQDGLGQLEAINITNVNITGCYSYVIISNYYYARYK